MPEIIPAFDYLKGLFFDMGQASPSGMGMIPIDWDKLRSWRLENHLTLTIWEKETLIKMSEAYCSEYSRASDPNRQQPYQRNIEELDEETQVEIGLRQALSWRSAIRNSAKEK